MTDKRACGSPATPVSNCLSHGTPGRPATILKRTGWRIRHDPSTGVRRHQCNRHKTLAHMGQAMRISQETRNKR